MCVCVYIYLIPWPGPHSISITRIALDPFTIEIQSSPIQNRKWTWLNQQKI